MGFQEVVARDGQPRSGHNVAFGRPPEVSQSGENDLSRNSRIQAHRSFGAH